MVCLFWAALGRGYCVRVFSPCGVLGLLTAVTCCRAQALKCGRRKLWLTGCGIFPEQGSNLCPCIDRWTLNHWTTIRGTLFNISNCVVQHRCKGAAAICTGRGWREARRCAGWVAPSLPYAGACFTYVVLSNRYDNMDSHHYLPEEEETEAQVKSSARGCADGKRRNRQQSPGWPGAARTQSVLRSQDAHPCLPWEISSRHPKSESGVARWALRRFNLAASYRGD